MFQKTGHLRSRPLFLALADAACYGFIDCNAGAKKTAIFARFGRLTIMTLVLKAGLFTKRMWLPRKWTRRFNFDDCSVFCVIGSHKGQEGTDAPNGVTLTGAVE